MIPLYVNGQQKIPYIHMSMVPSISSFVQNKPSPLNLLTCPNDPTSISYLVQNDPPQCPHLPKVTSLHLLTLKKFGPQIHPKSPPLTIYRAALSSAISSPWENVVPISPSIEKSEKMWISWTKLKKLKKVEIFLQKLEKVEKSEKPWKKAKKVGRSWKVWKSW